MSMQRVSALIGVELKKLYRDVATLAVLLLMPLGLALIFYVALSGITNDYYPVPGMNHFEYLLPGLMGYAIIYMGMMVGLALVDYREIGLLKRVEVTPVSASEYLGSLVIANMVIGVFQGLIVLLVARVLGYQPLGGVTGLLVAILFLALLSITAVGLGLITAGISKSTGAVSGLAMLFIVPMMIFGTLLAVFNDTTRTIAHFMPNYYVTDSLSIIFQLDSVTDAIIWRNFLILSAIAAGVVGVGILLFRRTGFR